MSRFEEKLKPLPRWEWVLGIILLVIIFAAIANLVAGCTNSTADCERVRGAINTRAAECMAHFEIRGDCDASNYVDGDIEACIAAVKAASCEELRQVARDKCLGLFGHGGL